MNQSLPSSELSDRPQLVNGGMVIVYVTTLLIAILIPLLNLGKPRKPN